MSEAAKPPSILTKAPPMLGSSPRSARALTFGSTSDMAASKRVLPQYEPTASNGADAAKKAGPETSIENLAIYLDWRNAKFSKDDINAELWKIALTIWDFLPASEPVFYTLNFTGAVKHTVANSRPPIRVATSLAGDLLYCFYSKKQYIDYDDTSTILVFMPCIDSIAMKGVSNWETTTNERCTWWEIEHTTVSHIGFDKDDHIYFTNGESVSRIMSLGGEAQYRQAWDEIWSPDGDTSHITSLWRQGSELYFTTQDWEKEDHLDLYKIKYKSGPGSTRNIHSPKSPGGRFRRSQGSAADVYKPRSPSGSGSPRSPSRSPSSDMDMMVAKVRTFSLEFNQRVWQLTWLKYEKKFLLGIAACRGGTQPQLMQISFKKQLKLVPLGSKHYSWPVPYDDTIPHDFIYHRPTRTYLLFLPVFSTKEGKDPSKNLARYWIQFRLDASKKKVIWHRLVPLPENLREGEWIYYDDIRDVLIGWQSTDDKEKQYTLKFLPDVSKLLWVDLKDATAAAAEAKESEQDESGATPKEPKKGKKDKKDKEDKKNKRPKSARKPPKSAAATATKKKGAKGDAKSKGKKGKNTGKSEKKSKKKVAKKKNTIAEDEMD